MCFMYAVNKFNLIGEGIFMLSACMVTWVSLSLQSLNLPAAVMVPIMYVVAILTGVVMAFIPAIMDRKFNANVVVVSLMLNSVIAYLATWILRYKVRDSGIAYMGSKEIPKSVQLPGIFGKFRIQSGLIVAVICVVIIAVLFYKTSFGWKMRLVGANPPFRQGCGPLRPRHLLCGSAGRRRCCRYRRRHRDDEQLHPLPVDHHHPARL